MGWYGWCGRLDAGTGQRDVLSPECVSLLDCMVLQAPRSRARYNNRLFEDNAEMIMMRDSIHNCQQLGRMTSRFASTSGGGVGRKGCSTCGLLTWVVWSA